MRSLERADLKLHNGWVTWPQALQCTGPLRIPLLPFFAAAELASALRIWSACFALPLMWRVQKPGWLSHIAFSAATCVAGSGIEPV